MSAFQSASEENWPLKHLPLRQTYKGVFADTNKYKMYK